MFETLVPSVVFEPDAGLKNRELVNKFGRRDSACMHVLGIAAGQCGLVKSFSVAEDELNGNKFVAQNLLGTDGDFNSC